MNNPDIQGVYVPPGVETAATEAPPPPSVPALPPAISSAPAQPITPAESRPLVQKLFFTGRLKSGKDTSANAAGATVFGFADPLYAIASHFFKTTITATEGKDLPGIREFLQAAGQWGRGVINEQYPLTPDRALFCEQIRETAQWFQFPQVDWSTFGNNPDIWLNACIARANEHLVAFPEARVAITNCRFENEFKRLQAEGFQHWHCMCGAKTRTERLAQSKLTPESPAVKDLSEHLAIKLDASVIKLLSAQKQGPQLRAIWSDKQTPKPSERLHSTESFLQSIGGAE